MRVRSISMVLAAMLLVTSSADAAPRGAIKLPQARVIKKKGYSCGNVKGSSWIPGKLLSGGYFYSHSAEKSNLAKDLRRAPRSKKKKIEGQIKGLNALMSKRGPVCARELRATPTPQATNTPTPQPTNSPTPQATNTPTPQPQPLRFNFSGAVGLTLKSATGAQSVAAMRREGIFAQAVPSSNLQKVSSAGTVSSAVSSGSATVSQFLIAPNDKLYVLFQSRTNLDDANSEGTCLLAEVDVRTGNPVCIDDTASAIEWSREAGNPVIQFDNSGAIYYLAYDRDNKLSLRKFDGQVSLDLINDNISIEDFLVVSDGSVLIAGRTNSSGQSWIRKINRAGGLQTIKNITACATLFNFMRVFPDNKVYFGIDDCSPGGIYRMEQTADALEAQPWMGFSAYYSGGGVGPIDLPAPIAFDCEKQRLAELPQGCGAMTRKSFRTTDGKMFFLGNYKLFKYYPTVERPQSSVQKPLLGMGVLGHIVLAGFNASDRNILTLFNTSDDSEIQLIGPDNEIEIYHLNYVASANKIMFDGLRFADNKYVIGQYDLNTMTFSASQTGSTKLVDFQTF